MQREQSPDRGENNHVHTHTVKLVKGSPSGRQKMIPAGNPNLYTGIKSVGNGVCVGREERLLFIF